MLRRASAILQLIRVPLILTAIGDSWSVYLLGTATASNPQLRFGRDMWLLACCSGGLSVAAGIISQSCSYFSCPGQDSDDPMAKGLIRTPVAWVLAGGALAIALISAWALGHRSFILALALIAMLLLYALGQGHWPTARFFWQGLGRALHAQLSMHFSLMGLWASAWLLGHVSLVSAAAGRLRSARSAQSWAGLTALALLVPFAALAMVSAGQALLLEPDQPVDIDLSSPMVAVASFSALAVWIAYSRQFGPKVRRGGMLAAAGYAWTLVYHMAFQSSVGNRMGLMLMVFLLVLTAASAQVTAALQRYISSRPEPSTG